MTNTAFGCCGSDRELRGLLSAADAYPRSSRAGQRARARLALALVERRARAAGDPIFAGWARAGLESLGTTADDLSRQQAVAAAIGTVRSVRGTGADDRYLTARSAIRVAGDIATVQSVLEGLVGLAQSIAEGVAAGEATKALREGREANFSARDTARALSWVRWLVGGDFPIGVAENDLRIFSSLVNDAEVVTAVNAALTAAKATALSQGKSELAAFFAFLLTYYRQIREAASAAVAALPPPAAPASSTPAVDLTRWSRVTTPAGVRVRCGDGSLVADPRNCPGSVWCSDGTLAPSAASCPEKKSSGVLLVLPAALLAWYLIK